MVTDNALSAENQQERPNTLIDLNIIPEKIAWYIAGFVDGEGSFNISLRKKQDYRLIWQPVLSFNVSQRERLLLDYMKNLFSCGIVKRRKDGLHSYDVTNPQALSMRIIPFFKKYLFFSKNKSKNFFLFVKATELMVRKAHLSQEGLREIILIREQINLGKGRTRKYSIKDVYAESSETIRQAPKGEDIVRTYGRP